MKQVILFIMVTMLSMGSETIILGNLEWQDNNEAKSIKLEQRAAKDYCRKLILSGHSDWRLPNIKELQSIVDVSKYNSAIKKEFSNVMPDEYWTSSAYAHTRNIWGINFSSGKMTKGYNYNKFYVRCVRGRQ